MRTKKIQEEIMERFPNDLRMENKRLYLNCKPIHIKKGLFSGFSMETEHSSVKGKSFETERENVYDVISSEILQMKILQAIRSFDEDAFIIKSNDTLAETDYLYIFQTRMKFKIFCIAAEGSDFKLRMNFFNGNKGLYVCDKYEVVLQEGIAYITKEMKTKRFQALTQKNDDFDIRILLYPFLSTAMQQLRLEYLMLDNGFSDIARKRFIQHFKQKYDTYLPYIDPIVEKKGVEKNVLFDV